MKHIKSLVATLLCLATVSSFIPMTVSAKSLSWVNTQMDYRRNLLSKSEFKTYFKSSPEDYVYYGAKFEPRSGIYIGTPYDRKYPDIKNACNTYYDWFVPSDEIKNDRVARIEKPEKKSDHTVLLGINWNFALKNSQIIDIREYTNYLYNKIDEWASWGYDILLIFGKEMNIDDNFNYPELFVDCFRFVADYAHTKENIAMVWAPNDTGGLDTTFKEYYPGDEYVDWIGCSLYTMPFFQGNPDIDDAANMSFIMGDYANPSMRAKMLHAFMEENNIKKPVMITEGGVGFESPKGIDYTQWAEHQLRMYYADICRIYPEYKCIISFNQYVIGDLYRYDMAQNPELLSIMKEYTSDPIYLTDYPSSAPYSYKEIYNGIVFNDKIELSSYAYIPKKQHLVVRYLIDGNWVAEKSEPPYAVTLDSSLVSFGEHTLTCEIYDGSTISHRKDYKIKLEPNMDSYKYEKTTDDDTCTFKDMEDKPSEMRNSVAMLEKADIINGLDKDTFAPDKRISRAEIATILTRMIGAKETDSPLSFSDVDKSNWYYETVRAAVSEGLIDGYEDNTFRGENAVTKNEFVTLIARILQNRCGKTVPNLALTYDDTVDDWAADYVRIVKDSNILLERTDNLFYGSALMSRGDGAIMLARLYKALQK